MSFILKAQEIGSEQNLSELFDLKIELLWKPIYLNRISGPCGPLKILASTLTAYKKFCFDYKKVHFALLLFRYRYNIVNNDYF